MEKDPDASVPSVFHSSPLREHIRKVPLALAFV